MKMKKQIHAWLVMLLLFSVLSLAGPLLSHAAPLDKGVTITVIDADGEPLLPLVALEITAEETALDMLERASDKAGIKLEIEEHPEFGAFIVSINEVSESEGVYWAFIVNGLLAEVGASSYIVEHGDHLLFSLTDDFSPTIDVTVSAQHGETEVIPETNLTLMAGATAYDALSQAILERDLTFDVTVDDRYFTFINNISETDLGDTGYWHVSVNEAELMMGLLQHQLTTLDAIELTVEHFDIQVEAPTQTDPVADLIEATPAAVGSITEEIRSIKTYLHAAGTPVTYGNEWLVWGLVQSGEQIPSTYLDSVREQLRENNGTFERALDLERVIITLSLLGEDATDFAGYDLITQLAEHVDLENPPINAAIFGLLAFASHDYKVDELVIASLVKAILDETTACGGWTFTGTTPSADITGMALAGLAPYQEEVAVEASLRRATDYLSRAQAEHGGFLDRFSNDYTSEGVAQVIIGLTALGIDPTSEAFTKNGVNLLDHLASYKKSDHGYGHLQTDEAASVFSTEQALLAYVAYDNFVQGHGSVYEVIEADRSVLLIAGLVLLVGGLGGLFLIRRSRSQVSR